MPSYEICYLDSNRKLIGQISTECSDDRSAAAFAYAMSSPKSSRLEVWSGDTLVLSGVATAIRESEKPVPIGAFRLRRLTPPHPMSSHVGAVRPRVAIGR